MDHHCPWVDNCIGFYNKKFFIQLLFYFLMTSFCFCITYIPYSIDIITTIIETYGKGNSKFIYKNFLILLNNIILFGFTILDFNFLKFHIKLISSNLTTIETLDKDLMQNQKYDMGFAHNFKQVFGENKILWFLPINLPSGYPNGDGLIWSTKEETISLDNLNINDNSKIGNTIENNNIEDNNTKNNSFIGRNGARQTRESTLKDYPISNRTLFGNYSKYSYVKRNSGHYNSNSTRYDSNSNKSKIIINKDNDLIST